MLYWGTDCISLSLRWWREKITHDRQTDMLESKISFNESVLALDLALPVVPRLALHQHSYLGKLAKLIFGKSLEFGPTGLTPPRTLGFPKRKKKLLIYFAF